MVFKPSFSHQDTILQRGRRHIFASFDSRTFSRAEFPWLHELEDAAADITEEMDTLARGGRVGDSYQSGTGEMSTVYSATQGWSTMRIRYMGRFVKLSDSTDMVGSFSA